MLKREDDGWIGKAALAAFALYLGFVFLSQIGFIADPDYLHEELRPLYRYHQVSDPSLFAGDYLTSFITAFPQPYFYESATRLWVSAGGHLDILHRLLVLVCWLAFLAGVAVAARRLGDRVTLVAAMGIVIAQPVYLHQITSALPHAFAFALMIWAFVALQYSSAVGLAVVTVLSGLLYPAVAPVVGLLLAWQVVVTDGVLTDRKAERVQGLLLLAAAGGSALWLLLDSLGGTAQFGAALEPMQNADLYPENGPEGRHFYAVFNPLTYVVAKAFVQFRDFFGTQKLYLLVIYCVVAVYGFVVLLKERAACRTVAVFVVCSAAFCLLVFAVKPFLLYRFILYPALTVLPLMLAVGLQQFFQRLGGIVRQPATAAVATCLLFVLTLDSADQKKIGYVLRVGPEQRQVLDFAAMQPADTLFAIWPSGNSTMEFIPYFARRPLFVMIKLHYPTYEDHLLAMRARMTALIDAYLATEEPALQRLYCQWGVDYLIAEKAHFAEDGERPRYFAPFDARIAEIWGSHSPSDFLLQHPDSAAVALETARYTVLDLAAVAGGAGCAPAEGMAEVH